MARTARVTQEQHDVHVQLTQALAAMLMFGAAAINGLVFGMSWTVALLLVLGAVNTEHIFFKEPSWRSLLYAMLSIVAYMATCDRFGGTLTGGPKGVRY